MHCMELSLVLVTLGVASLGGVQGTCDPKYGTTVSFSVTSRRNHTGHRLVTANVRSVTPQHAEQPALSELAQLADPQEVSMFVEHHSSGCDGAEDVSITATLAVPSLKVRRLDYELFPGLGYYKLHLEPSPWDEARRECGREGAHLAVINSEAEAQVLKKIFSSVKSEIQNATYSHVAAIGFHDLQREGSYLTIFGEPLSGSGYMVWGDGQPNNAGWGPDTSSDCGGVDRSGKLNDLPCHSRTAFFCEQEL